MMGLWYFLFCSKIHHSLAVSMSVQRPFPSPLLVQEHPKRRRTYSPRKNPSMGKH